jgi:hypothetical protein
MKIFAQIINNKLHWKFEAEVAPQFAPDVVIMEITGMNPIPEEGWSFINGKFNPPRPALYYDPDGTGGWIYNIAKHRDIKKAEMSAACKNAIEAGFASAALGAVFTYPSTILDQHNLNARVTESQVTSIDATWRCKFMCRDGGGVWVRRLHNHAQIEQVGLAGVAYVSAQLDRLDQRRLDIDAALTVVAIQAIIW